VTSSLLPIVSNESALRKARGAFFTPIEITRFVARWAIRKADETVLEPSCGEAAFLVAAGNRLQELGASPNDLNVNVNGIDIHEESVDLARTVLATAGVNARVWAGDFFGLQSHDAPKFDAVIGNPPYIRYQQFGGDARGRALEAALRQGVRLNRLASSWAAFTVHAASFLKSDGRLGLVLPAELLSVNYAAEVRRFLLNRFSSVKLILFENLVFPGVLEEVVLLLAEGSGGASKFELYQAKDANSLDHIDTAIWTRFSPRGDEKWTSALVPGEAIDLYQELTMGHQFEVLLDWGETYLGAVTGNNDYFSLTRKKASSYRLPASDLMRISPPGSKHLRGLGFTERNWYRMLDEDEQCLLFYPKSDRLSKPAQRYVEFGESTGVQKAYKCKVRSPWWRVPLVETPDLFFTYMNHERPRLSRNDASVQFLNSLYGVKLHLPRKNLGTDLLPMAALNSLTSLGAEIVGRSYGGGMLKHEPKEADLLPLPSQQVLQRLEYRLKLLRPQVAAKLRSGRLAEAIDIIDRTILCDGLSMTEQQVAAIRQGRDALFKRRATRGRSSHGAN